MKRRFICLFLSIVMLMTAVLSACSSAPQEEETEEVDNSAKTIVMWVMTPEIADEDKEAAKRAQELVQEEFSKITKAKFKTNVVLKFVSPDEYVAELRRAIQEEEKYVAGKEEAAAELELYLKGVRVEDREERIEEFYAENPKYEQYRATIDDEMNQDKEEEYETNEWGVKQTKYPAARDGQVDIFYMQGQKQYEEFYANGWLAKLDDELSLSSKKLTSYIATSLLGGIQRDGGTYAIPNNVAIGQYTYAMIDREIFDSTWNNPYAVENVADLDRFLGDVMTLMNAGKTAEDEGYVVPLASTFQECMDTMVWYWDLSYTDRTVYETYYDAKSGRNYVLGCKYDVTVQDEENPEGKKETRVVPYAKQDQIYEVNEDGQYVNAKGEVLNYRYRTDDTYRYQVDGLQTRETGIPKKIDPVKVSDSKDAASQAGGMYLVDEDRGGIPVTPENDERVVLVVGEEDVDGKLEMPKYYDEEGNEFDATLDGDGQPYFITSKHVKLVTSEQAQTNLNQDGWVRQTFYYDYNSNPEFSLVGTVYPDASLVSRGDIDLKFTSLMADPEYQRIYSTLKGYELNGYYGTPDSSKNQKAAVSFVKGDSRIKYESEKNGGVYKDEHGTEYYVFVAKYPQVSEAELYGNMFGVYAGSNNLTRCMEVLTRLNTDPDLRNLLQYGVEGKHYVLEEDEQEDGSKVKLVQSLLGESRDSAEYKAYGQYRMKIEQTGNSFIVYPTVAEGKDKWLYAKLQNSDSLIYPLMDFDFNVVTSSGEYNMDTALIEYLRTESATVQAALDECEDMDAVEALLATYRTTYLKSNANIDKATRYDYDPAKDGKSEHVNATRSPYEVYVSWQNAYGYQASGKKQTTN